MKHYIIPKALRWMAAAGLCLAAAACSKDDITPESAPQEDITPTKIIFNVTRGGYEDDAETRAPKSGWQEGDVVYFGKYQQVGKGKAIYTGGEWAVTMTESIPGNSATLFARYAENVTGDKNDHLSVEHGDVAYTTSGSYKVDEKGVATITLSLNQHPHGRMTFTGVGKGKELTVLGMKYVSYFPCDEYEPAFTEAPITLTGEDDGTATLYALPTADIVTEAGITLTVKYDGKFYTKTFASKEFKAKKSITLAVPSTEGGWTDATTIPVMSVTLNKTVLTLETGASETLTATVAPAEATNKKVTWKSDKPEIASVDANGKVTGVAAGEATITVTTEDGAKTATCKVTVTTIPVTGVTLNKTSTAIAVGVIEELTATITPANATNQKVTWKSSDPAVARVKSNGTVLGVSVGEATITVTTEDGGKTATCKVRVLSKVNKVTVTPANLTLGKNKRYTLTATVDTQSGPNTGVTWKSSNPLIARVSSKGEVITLDKVGEVTITATSIADPTKKGTCTITVSADQAGIGLGGYGPEENW